MSNGPDEHDEPEQPDEEDLIKIAFIIPTLDQIGGAERQTLLLAKQLAQRNWQVSMITLSGTGSNVREDLLRANVELVSLEMRKAWIDPRGWLRYLAWARASGPDIIHAHLPHATWFARCIRMLSPVRIVMDTVHTARPASMGKRLTYCLTQDLGDHTTCVSQATADSALAARILDPTRCSIVHNGIPLSDVIQPNAHRFGHFHWVAVGRLASVKDYPTLLRAFAALPPNPQTRLTIVGTGPEEDNLKHLAATLQAEQKTQSHIEFAGFHSDVWPFLANADAFVLTSLWEGLPISVLEAQVAGLPIVATDTEGTREAVDPQHSATLLPSGDIKALTSAMHEIMQLSPEQRADMGKKGRRFVEQNFSMLTIVERWEQLYSQLLQTHPHPSRHA